MQSKYCRKLTRLNNITYASRNLFTSAWCSCDAVYSSAQWQLVFRHVCHFFGTNFDDIVAMLRIYGIASLNFITTSMISTTWRIFFANRWNLLSMVETITRVLIMLLHVIDLGWVAYVTLRYVVSACTGRLTCEIFAKIIFADSLQWPVCNYLLCNNKDSSHCN